MFERLLEKFFDFWESDAGSYKPDFGLFSVAEKLIGEALRNTCDIEGRS